MTGRVGWSTKTNCPHGSSTVSTGTKPGPRYLIRIGDHGLRKADSINWLVVRSGTSKKTGQQYESDHSWTGTLRAALECLYQRVLDEHVSGVELEHLADAIAEARKTVAAEVLEALPEVRETLSEHAASTRDQDRTGADWMRLNVPVRKVAK